MTLLFKQLFAFFRLLNSETGTNQLAAGLTFGMFLGFSPFLSLQTMIIFIILLFFRIQIGAAFVSAFFFKFVAFLIDPAADILGRFILEADGLRPLWVSLYNMPIVPFTRFNNSIAMGSLAVAIVLTVPMFFIFRILVVKYRAAIVARIKQTKIWKAIAATKFYNWYVTYDKLYGA